MINRKKKQWINQELIEQENWTGEIDDLIYVLSIYKKLYAKMSPDVYKMEWTKPEGQYEQKT